MASIVPKSIAEQYHVVPIKLEKDKLILAMEDPLNFRALEAVKQITKYKVTPYIAYASAVERAILVLYENEGASIAIEQMKQERGIDATFEEVAKQSDVTSKSSAAQLLS